MDDRLLCPNPTITGTGLTPHLRSLDERHISYQASYGHNNQNNHVNQWLETSLPALGWAVQPDAIVDKGLVAQLNSALKI